MSVTESQTDVDLDAILDELDHGSERLPRRAIQAARANCEAIIPRLIEVIENATESAQRGEVLEGDGPFMALMLLAEFRAREALPVLRRALYDDNSAETLFGDLIVDMVGEIVLSLGNDSTDVLNEFVYDEKLDEFTRAGIASAFTYLARDQVIAREQAVEHLRAALRHATETEKPELAAFLIADLITQGAVEALDDIEEAYRKEAVAEEIVGNLADVRRDLSDPKRRRVINRRRHINDVIGELEKWHSFKAPVEREPLPSPSVWQSAKLPMVPKQFVPSRTVEVATSAPVADRARRVGRNDPCPCGSGKKFKKCCYGR